MNEIQIINPRKELHISLEKINDTLLLIINHYDSRYGFETTHYGISQEQDSITFGIIPVDQDWTENDVTLVKLKLKLNQNYSHFYSRNKEQEIIALIPNIINAQPIVSCHNVTNFDHRHGENLINGFTKVF